MSGLPHPWRVCLAETDAHHFFFLKCFGLQKCMDTSKTELGGHVQVSAAGLALVRALRRQQILPERGDGAEGLQDSQDLRHPGSSLGVQGGQGMHILLAPQFAQER